MQLNQFNNNLYVLSAANSYRDKKVNDQRHENLKANMEAQHVAYSECEGKYDGAIEKSLILIGTHKLTAHHYASFYNQDCFLRLAPHRDNMYRAYRIDTVTGDELFTGFFRSFDKANIDALGLDYTKDNNGTYFSIWLTDTDCRVQHLEEIGTELLDRMERGQA